MSALSVVGVQKSFPSAPVLTGVDLEVDGGSLTALLGASGSGKTTLLRLIAGFERVDGGEIRLDGELVESAGVHRPPEHRHLGLVPQDGALFPHLTVRANVQFGLPRKSRRGPDTDDLIGIVGLAGFAHRYPHELSGGERQRVALARALAVHPRLVLLDEPFSSLDAGLRQSLRADVRAVLRAAGATALLVTHDQDEALSLADRIAVLRDGRVIQHGTPRELYESPVDEPLAQFLGDATIVDGALEGRSARTALGRIGLIDGTGGADVPHAGGLRVLLRPEQIRVGETRTADALEAEVIDTTYVGHSSLVRFLPLAACGAEVLLSRTENRHPLVPGQRVALTVSETDAARCWGVGADQ